MSPETLIAQALCAERGIVISTDNPKYAIVKLRKALNSLGYHGQIVISVGRKDTSLLFLRKSTISLPSPEEVYAKENPLGQ